MDTFAKLKMNILEKVPSIRTGAALTEKDMLWFAGEVSTVRASEASLPLCILKDRNLSVVVYLNGEKHRTVASQLPVPAWMCNTCAKPDLATMKFLAEITTFSSKMLPEGKAEITFKAHILQIAKPVGPNTELV